jgi:hypothetical protein
LAKIYAYDSKMMYKDSRWNTYVVTPKYFEKWYQAPQVDAFLTRYRDLSKGTFSILRPKLADLLALIVQRQTDIADSVLAMSSETALEWDPEFGPEVLQAFRELGECKFGGSGGKGSMEDGNGTAQEKSRFIIDRVKIIVAAFPDLVKVRNGNLTLPTSSPPTPRYELVENSSKDTSRTRSQNKIMGDLGWQASLKQLSRNSNSPSQSVSEICAIPKTYPKIRSSDAIFKKFSVDYRRLLFWRMISRTPWIVSS